MPNEPQDISTRRNIRMTQRTAAAITQYRADRGFTTDAAAIRQLVRIGLAVLAERAAQYKDT